MAKRGARPGVKHLDYTDMHWESKKVGNMWSNARRRAEKRGIPFDLTMEQVFNLLKEARVCPLLGVTLTPGTKSNTDTSPSLDCICVNHGYTLTNVWIISEKANRMKSNATLDEWLLFAQNTIKILT